jgi:hypothetical protein
MFHFECAYNFLALAQVFAVFNADDNGVDDFAVAFAFGEVVSADLGPEDGGAMDYFESMSVVDFYFVGDIGTFDDGSVGAMSGLDLVDSLVETKQLIH